MGFGAANFQSQKERLMKMVDNIVTSVIFKLLNNIWWLAAIFNL